MSWRPEDETASREVLARVDGELAAGRHVLLDLWGCEGLADPHAVRHALEEAAKATGATILGGSFHHFGPGMGVSGTLLLAESHASIHTWPEVGHATADMFTCGQCDPRLALPVLVRLLRARASRATVVTRGTWAERPEQGLHEQFEKNS